MQKVKQALEAFGLNPDVLIPDGQIYRCSSSAKTKKNKDGWYAITRHEDNLFCVYGCWLRGENRRYSSLNSNDNYTNKVWHELELERQKEEEARKITSRLEASNFLKGCIPAAANHPYLVRKQIKPNGIFQKDKDLIIPVYDQGGKVSSYQMITENGDKWFMSGGIIGGGCFPIEGITTTVCICEGFATGASIAEATGFKTLVAFNCGNLKKVAGYAKKIFKNSMIIICCDNDHTKKKNIGLKKGKEAAKAFKLACVWPTGIIGSDFNDMMCEKGIRSVCQAICKRETIEIMDKKDFKKESLNLEIPKAILKTGGLIQEGLELLHEQGLPEIPQLNLPSVLTVLANIISTKICFGKTYCNLFTLKIGRTSVGKSRADDELTSEINAVAKTDINLKNCSKMITEFSSGAALYKALETSPHLLCCIDEGTELFKRYKNKNPLQEEKKNTLLTLYTKAGKEVKKNYANNKQTIILEDHCLSILTNATPVIFDELSSEDFETGLFQRIDLWCYDGKTKYWNNKKPKKIAKQKFLKHLQKMAACTTGRDDRAVADTLCIPYSLTGTKEFFRLKAQWSEEIVDMVNGYNDDIRGGLVARGFDLSIKYAIIHAGSIRPLKGIYEPLNEEDLQWGIIMARMLVNWKIDKLLNRVTTGELDADIEYFKRAIKKTMVQGKQAPTFKYMMYQNKKMKNWGLKYSNEIINILQKRKEIVIDDSGRTTKYFLAKKVEGEGN